MIDFVNNSEPDLTAENLNKMQQDIGTVVSPTEPQGAERLKVWVQKGKNLFDGQFIQGAISATGSFVYYAENIISKNLIEVMPNTNYVFSCEQGIYPSVIITYDKNKNFMDRIGGYSPGKFLIDENTHYIILQFYNEKGIKPSDVNKPQFEQNTTATSYEAYIEPKIYVLNNNGVYEEFIKKTTEFKIVSTMGSKDFNTFTKNGFYQCNFQNGTNAPDTYSTGMLLVFGNYYIAQLYIADLNSKAKAFVRMSTNQGASWNSWVTLA